MMIDDGMGIGGLSHLCRAHRMENRRADIAGQKSQFFVGLETHAW